MKSSESAFWGIHAGATGDAEALFLKKDVVALGWPEVGDLSRLAADREAFKTAVGAAYPDKVAGAIPNNAGQLYRFVHEVEVGDLVAYPSKATRQIHLGRIQGKYRYAPELSAAYPNTRAVKWLEAVPRTRFSQGALYEIGSAMSLFQVRNYVDEFRAILDGKPTPAPSDTDSSVGAIAESTEENARDFVLKRLARTTKGHPFAHFVAHLLNKMGYRTRVAQAGPDGGIDILAHKDELGFEPPIIKVQVKSSEERIGEPTVSALCGKVGDKENGLFVTLGSFTAQAENLARSRSNIRLIGGAELVELILAHYEEFDSQYRRLVPLKRIYIPQPSDDEA